MTTHYQILRRSRKVQTTSHVVPRTLFHHQRVVYCRRIEYPRSSRAFAGYVKVVRHILLASQDGKRVYMCYTSAFRVSTSLISSMTVVKKVKKPAHFWSISLMAPPVKTPSTWYDTFVSVCHYIGNTSWIPMFVFTGVCTYFKPSLWPTIPYVALLLALNVCIELYKNSVSWYFLVALLAVTVTNVSC